MNSSEVKTERLVARVRGDVKSIIEKAAVYSGASVSQFVVDSALERANTVINNMEVLKLSEQAFKKMMDVLDNPPEPNAYLKKLKHIRDKEKYANSTVIQNT